MANSASVNAPRSCSEASFSSRSSRPGGPDKPMDPTPADVEPNQLRAQFQGDVDVEGDAGAEGDVEPDQLRAESPGDAAVEDSGNSGSGSGSG